jgi:2-oxoisovalerate dehydrogenase E1 component alpha subunit
VTSLRREGESAEDWSRRDPIARMRRFLEVRGLTSSDRDERLVADVRGDVERALVEAAGAALPGRDDVFDDVFAAAPWHLREQRRELQKQREAVLSAEAGTET